MGHPCFLLFFIYFFVTGKSAQVREVEMSDAERVEKLLGMSIAPATRIKYCALWRRWEHYCRVTNATALPADPSVFECFLARVAFDGSKTNCTAAAAAVAWHHSVAGYVSPTKSPRISAIIAGANRMLAAPAARKVPLTIGLLVQLVEFSVSSPSASSTDTPLSLQRFRFFALVSFFRFSSF
jgi:hypothetical protein